MKNILAIGAHPDDIEISCLGYLLKNSIEKKSKISVFIVSSGSLKDPTSGMKRIKESKEALRCIKGLNFYYRATKGIKIKDFEKISNNMRKLILDINPNEILGLEKYFVTILNRLKHINFENVQKQKNLIL